jgi:hypothetical protein
MSSIQRLCSIEECGKKRRGLGYCGMHLRRFHLYGNPHTVKVVVKQHGLSKTWVWSTWKNIRTRTTNKNVKSYKDYGARGIVMCERWRTSMLNFYEDVGERPSPKHSIDRRDSNGNYSCGKCRECLDNDWPTNWRWVTRDIQVWNRRKMKSNSSGYIGVTVYSYLPNKWSAKLQITDRGKRYTFWVGHFATPEEAAIAYDQAAIFFRGEYAVTNIL